MEYKKSSHQKSDFDGVEEWLNSFDLAEDDVSQHQINGQRQHLQEFIHLDDLYLDVLSPPFQSCEDEIMRLISVKSKDTEVKEPKKSRAGTSPSHESFEVLRKYNDRISDVARARAPSFSIVKIIKLAESERGNELSVSDQTLSKEVRLVQNLLSCAESIAEKQHERAVGFLKVCGEMSSAAGTPIQRLAFYFSEALRLKIGEGDREEKRNRAMLFEPAKFVDSMPTYFKQFPVSQISNLVGSQTILRYLHKARRVHVVDLEIRSGVHWVQFMQDVAARRDHHPIRHLRITAVGEASKESILEETGRQLASFAESVNLKFTFGVVLVEDVLELNKDGFGLDSGEHVVVYAAYALVMMIGRPDRLDHLMKVIRSLGPCIMVATEIEANCNSPSFVELFVGSLFLFGAFFDSLSDCLKDQETSRMDLESTLFRSSINNVLVAEGEERMLRHVPIDAWRACFAGFGLVETELSFQSLDQANLLLRDFSYGSSITLCRNGGCLIVVWKGTALTSLSAWKIRKH